MTLENKLGITDSMELARSEERITKEKAIELFTSGYLNKLQPGTVESLQKIHAYIFGDVYNFAGKI